MIKIISMSAANIKKWAVNPRFYIIAALLFILTHYFVSPFQTIAVNLQYRITPWIFPLITSATSFQIFTFLGLIFLLCDAPFMDYTQPFYLIRCTRKQWTLAQILYIFSSVFIYLLFINLCILIILSPVLFFDGGWGKVLSTLAQVQIEGLPQTFPIHPQILSNFTPVKAMALSFFLEWCVGIILGLVMFLFNTIFSRSFGTILAAVLVLFDGLISAGLRPLVYHFSPISLAKLANIDTLGLSQYPSLHYAVIILPVVIIFLSFLSVQVMKKREIKMLSFI